MLPSSGWRVQAAPFESRIRILRPRDTRRVHLLPHPAGALGRGPDIFAVKAAAEYQASATYDDVLDIGCRVARIGRSSMQFRLGIFRGAEQLTSGELVYVNADPRTRRSAPWPEPLEKATLGDEKLQPDRA